MTDAVETVLSFWFGDLDGPYDVDRSKSRLWWRGGAETDAYVTEHFGDLVRQACAGALEGWTATPRGTLALVVLLDQLTRNIFRGRPEAYQGDVLAQSLVRHALGEGQDRELRLIERSFLYMPLVHAEDREAAKQALALFTALSADIKAAPVQDHPDFLGSAQRHADIVLQFGRYPHRNRLFGRESTEEELAFMKDGGPTFGQRPRQEGS